MSTKKKNGPQFKKFIFISPSQNGEKKLNKMAFFTKFLDLWAEKSKKGKNFENFRIVSSKIKEKIDCSQNFWVSIWAKKEKKEKGQ